MNIYYNAEYTGAHEDAKLISMGFIAEDGSRLYLEFSDIPVYSVNSYIEENVFPDTYLYDRSYNGIEKATSAGAADLGDDYCIVTRSTAILVITQWFQEVLSGRPEGETIQLVSYCSHYDASLLYNLFQGYLPLYLNAICYDIVGLVMHYTTDWKIDLPLSARLRDTLRDSRMEELATDLGHPISNYSKNHALRHAEIIRNVYEGLKEFGKY